MKTNHLLAMTLPLLAIVFAMSCNPNKPQEPTSYEDAKNKVLQLYDTDSVDIYMASAVLSANSIIYTWADSVMSPKQDCWYIFVDKMPLANWGLPCDYVFITQEKSIVVVEHRRSYIFATCYLAMPGMHIV